MTTDEILALPDVKERIDIYFEQAEKFKEMVKAHTHVLKRMLSSATCVVLTRFIQVTASLFTASILSRIFPLGLSMVRAARAAVRL